MDENREELVALVKYLTGHNISHTAELKDLASSFLGTETYDKIMLAVAEYEKGNEYLSAALAELEE
ncbi:MAG: hypothetical protein IKT04_02685 [Clostridia bacterium]|nr:hypothetical protein [Clostridia bacterium]